MATLDAIRQTIVDELKTVVGFGGDEKNVRKYSFEVDDPGKSRLFWESTFNGKRIINGAMLTRVAHRTREIAAGGSRILRRVHGMQIVFRFGDQQDALDEKKFEQILELAIQKMQSNDTIFKIDGKHPQTDDGADQTVTVAITNKKLFHERVWEALMDFDIVTEENFIPS